MIMKTENVALKQAEDRGMASREWCQELAQSSSCGGWGNNDKALREIDVLMYTMKTARNWRGKSVTTG